VVLNFLITTDNLPDPEIIDFVEIGAKRRRCGGLEKANKVGERQAEQGQTGKDVSVSPVGASHINTSLPCTSPKDCPPHNVTVTSAISCSGDSCRKNIYVRVHAAAPVATEVVILQRGQYGNPADLFTSKRWIDYVEGFSMKEELWYGLDKMAALTATGTWQLTVDLKDHKGGRYRAVYGQFSVGPAPTYTLTVGSFDTDKSSLQDSLKNHNGMKFSTHDRDQDTTSSNCAQSHQAAWWYKSCMDSLLTGYNYNIVKGSKYGIYWDNSNNVKEQSGFFSWPYAVMTIVRTN